MYAYSFAPVVIIAVSMALTPNYCEGAGGRDLSTRIAMAQEVFGPANGATSSTKYVNKSAMLAGYDKNGKGNGKPFQRTDTFFKLSLLDGSPVFIENTRRYNITDNVIGWIGHVVDSSDGRQGIATFEFYENGTVTGNIRVSDRVRVKIGPSGSTGSEVIEVSLTAENASRQGTPSLHPPRHEQPTLEELDDEIAEWRRRYNSDEFAVERKKIDDLILEEQRRNDSEKSQERQQ